jgi:2-dehydro-3-deoxyphosphogluconate aldolase/(4S)-4-hydroxy-2-oxoglutarate aldolase
VKRWNIDAALSSALAAAAPVVGMRREGSVHGQAIMDVDRFREFPLLGIVRGIAAEDVAPLAEVVIGAGLPALEITMNTADAPALIGGLVEAARGRIMVGAGTVLTVAALDAALDAGATFIVMPTLVADVVARCRAAGVPCFPGALTPQEIFAAWTAGATMVKVFPAGCFGPGYFKEVKGPFHDIELLACGGVDATNMGAYFAAGASAVAFGASVFRADWLRAGDYARIGTTVGHLVQACRAVRAVAA